MIRWRHDSTPFGPEDVVMCQAVQQGALEAATAAKALGGRKREHRLGQIRVQLIENRLTQTGWYAPSNTSNDPADRITCRSRRSDSLLHRCSSHRVRTPHNTRVHGLLTHPAGVDISADIRHGIYPGDHLYRSQGSEHLPGNRATRHTSKGLASARSAAADPGPVPVLGIVGKVRMGGPILLLKGLVGTGVCVAVIDNETNWCSQGFPFEEARQELELVSLLSLSRQRRLPRPTPSQLRLNLGQVKHDIRGAALDDTPKTSAMGFTETRQPKQLSKATASHEPPSRLYYISPRRAATEAIDGRGPAGALNVKDALIVSLFSLVPRKSTARIMGRVARATWSRWLTRLFVAAYGVDLTEATGTISDYRSLEELFTRKLKPGARPIDQTPESIVSPVDGTLAYFGSTTDGLLELSNGQTLNTQQLLGAESLVEQDVAILYLSPTEYHRVHVPREGEATSWRYVPGDLWMVFPPAVRQIKGLFQGNERAIVHFETDNGPVDVVLVGAFGVGRISLAVCDLITNTKGLAASERLEPAQTLQRGEPLGVFHLGSTVILCSPKGSWRWTAPKDTLIRMGEPLGYVNRES
jgi:phosphatidylserine decarboxylase